MTSLQGVTRCVPSVTSLDRDDKIEEQMDDNKLTTNARKKK